MKMLLFDIDGTLLMTGGAGKIAFNRVFEELFGIQQAWGHTVPHGKTDPALIAEIAHAQLKRDLTPEEEQRVSRLYIRYFEEEIGRSPGFRLMQGVHELLTLFQQTGRLVMGIASGNFEHTSWLKLSRGGIQHFFNFGGYGSDAPDRPGLVRKAIERGEQHTKKKIHGSDIYVIGDTEHDIAAGKCSGAKTVAVLNGLNPREALARHKPDFIWDDFSRPEALLADLTGADRFAR